MTSNQNVSCDYCGSEELAYELRSDRGIKSRCIPCLAIEQGQGKLRLPLDSYDDLDDDLLQSGYEGARDWFRVLARWRQDDPLVKRDPSDPGPTLAESTRTFLSNIMGSAAHYPPSEVVEGAGDPEQTTLGGGD